MAEKSDKAKGEKRFDIEEDLSQVEVPDILPVLPLRGIVIFPNQIHPFLVSRPASLRLIEDVGQASRVIGLSAQKNPEEENPAPEGLFPRGTAVRILKMLKYPDHSVRVLVQGIARIDLLDFVQLEPYFRANVRRLSEAVEGEKELDALRIAADGVNALRSPGRAMVVITHYQRLLNYIVPDFVHVMSRGRVVKSGGKELALELEASGYTQFEDAAA